MAGGTVTDHALKAACVRRVSDLGVGPLHIGAGQVRALLPILQDLWLQGEDGDFWTDIPNTQIRRVTAKRLLEAKQVSQWLPRGVSSFVRSATAPSTAILAGRKADCAGLPASLLGRRLTSLCRPLSLIFYFRLACYCRFAVPSGCRPWCTCVGCTCVGQKPCA